MAPRGFRLLLLGLIAAVVAACGSPEPPAAAELPDDVGPVTADPTVTVVDNRFDPDEVVVEVGTEVTWVWEGRAAHNVVGDGFESELLVSGTFAHTFDATGSFAYVCTVHPGQEGVVHVVPAGG